MKKFPLVMLSSIVLAAAGCSRSDKAETSVKPPTPNPNAEQLKRDSERLQQATANAAREREKAAQAAAAPSSTP